MCENEEVWGVGDDSKDLTPGACQSKRLQEKKREQGRLIQSWRKMFGFILGTPKEDKYSKFAMLKRDLFMIMENSNYNLRKNDTCRTFFLFVASWKGLSIL